MPGAVFSTHQREAGHDTGRLKTPGVDTRCPTISVGNLALGGRGKTPTVAYVARLLLELGERPAILSRGYKRRRPEDGVVIVSDGRHLRADLARAGDEPLMLARLVPGAAVLVCEVRTLAAAVAQHVLGCTVHLLDDGFQHRPMRRDLDIVLVTAADLGDRRLPFGRLRSPVSALGAAHAVVLDEDGRRRLRESASDSAQSGGRLPESAQAESAQAAVRAVAPNARMFTLRRALGAAQLLEPAENALGSFSASAGPVLAVAGIARPERFTASLEAAGWAVAGTLAFADHHAYSTRDLARIANACRAAGAIGVVTTTKDAIRLLPLRPLPVPIAAVPLDVSLEPRDEFRAWLIDRLEAIRRDAD